MNTALRGELKRVIRWMVKCHKCGVERYADVLDASMASAHFKSNGMKRGEKGRWECVGCESDD